MKSFLANRQTVSRAKARNATLVNLFATPGLGSLMCRRWLEGAGQLIIALVGAVLICIWFFREMAAFYSTAAFTETPMSPPDAKMLLAGSVLMAASWFWSLVTSLSLMREAKNEKLEALKDFAASAKPLTPPEIALALTKISDWQRNGVVISRTFQFKDFPAAMRFVNAVAAMAEAAWHHPDIDVRWNKVTLALTTHDAGGLSEKDFALAKKFDELSLR